MAQPRKPNILVTGTPGCGKSLLCQALCQAEPRLKHIDVSVLVREQGLYEGRDAHFDTLILDEDRIVDELEPTMVEGGIVLDTHTADYFPERWFGLVVVLRTSTAPLFDRLTARGYAEHKRTENMESEIMNVCLDEARESYPEAVLLQLQSDELSDLDNNVEAVLNAYRALRGGGAPTSAIA